MKPEPPKHTDAPFLSTDAPDILDRTVKPASIPATQVAPSSQPLPPDPPPIKRPVPSQTVPNPPVKQGPPKPHMSLAPKLPSTRADCQAAMDKKHDELEATKAKIITIQGEIDGLIQLNNRLPRDQ